MQLLQSTEKGKAMNDETAIQEAIEEGAAVSVTFADPTDEIRDRKFLADRVLSLVVRMMSGDAQYGDDEGGYQLIDETLIDDLPVGAKVGIYAKSVSDGKILDMRLTMASYGKNFWVEKNVLDEKGYVKRATYKW